MHDFLNNFKDLVKRDQVRTDNGVFKMHYKFSVILLIIFSILLSSKQYFGEPITCDVESRKEIVDVFCWATGTFVLVDNIDDKYLRAANLDRLGNGVGKTRYTLLYYQWVCLLFCLQALMFYLPRYIWNSWEGDRLGQIVKDLCGPIVSDKWSHVYKEKMRNYILKHDNHNVFAYRFAFCEFLNFCNLIFQTMFMDWYLNGKFSSYGYEVATKPWPDAYNTAFPKRTKCIYTRYGNSGGIEIKDALCVLPLNVLNEKFFLLLWYWMIIMYVATSLALIYRFMIIVWTTFRTYLLMAQVRSLNRHTVRFISRSLTHGQFFLLYNMGRNINPIIYKDLLISLFDHLDAKNDSFGDL